MPPVHVLLPAGPGLDLPGGPPDGVRLLRWNGRGELPAGADQVRFWTPPLLARADVVDRALAGLPDLEVVQLVTAGAEVFIRRLPTHVTLCDGRGVHGSSTSEWVAAGLLAAVRQIPRFVLAQSRGEWDYTPTGEVAGRLAPFDVELTMVARTARPGVHPVSALPDLLPRHDVVVLVVPLTEQTRGMVDKAFLARMP